MEGIIQDVRFAVRILMKERGFAITAIATLAVCIGANAAIFAVVNAVVLKPLPFPDSDRILFMYNSYPNAGAPIANTGVPDYFDRLRDVTAFQEQALYRGQGVTIGEEGSVQRVSAMGVTPSFFRLLQAQPLLGRTFSEDEGQQGNETKIVLTHSLWQKLFGGEKSCLGKVLRLNGVPHTIVGVMPKDFSFLRPNVKLWRPLAFTPEQKSDGARHSNNWQMIGRLRPGATIEQAQAQINALNAANLERFPQFKQVLVNAGFHTEVVRLKDDVVRDIKKTLYLLWGGVLFVLLIGAVNVANLVMARSNVRVRELATRFSLGAAPWRVTRQLLTESILLTTCAAGLGLLLGYWGLRMLNTLGIEQIPRGTEVRLDAAVVLFAFAVALVVGLAIAAIPVVHGLKANMSSVFREERSTGTGWRGARILRNALAVTQVAFALVLLIGAGLLLASFRAVLAIKPGFVPQNVLTAAVSLPRSSYRDAAAIRHFGDRALDGIRALPGVVSAGLTDNLPFSGDHSDSVILAEGYQMRPGESLISPNQVLVTPGYMESLHIPLIEGRYFDKTDKEDSLPVIIIDEKLARKFWPDRSPLGKRMWRPTGPEDLVKPGANVKYLTIVGVVRSIKQEALVEAQEQVGTCYSLFAQNPSSGLVFSAKTSTSPANLTSAMRRVITELDPMLPLFDIRAMEERIDDSLISRRSPMLITLVFGGIALFLAAVGVYGVLAYLVSQRSRELGIRMALGSDPLGIFRLIMNEGILVIAVGFVLGLGSAFWLRRFLEGMLYGVRSTDPVVLGLVTAVLAAASLAACIVPARRATKVNPIVALRQE